jgi:FkbM family methyltransferase
MGLLRKTLSPKHAYAAEHLFPSKRRHRQRMIQHYSEFINNGDLVFDVGANLGERTMVFRALGAKVIAIEPTQYCSQYLKQLFKNDPNVTVVPQALGAEPGTGEININENLPVLSTMSGKWSTESRFSKDYTWEKKEIISITTLDYLIKEHGIPKFCKIDVEGFEYQVLRGLSTPIPVISFEFLFEFLNDAKLCMEKITSLSTVQYNYNIGEEMGFTLPLWTSGNIVIESIREQNNAKLWGDIYAKAIL